MIAKLGLSGPFGQSLGIGLSAYLGLRVLKAADLKQNPHWLDSYSMQVYFGKSCISASALATLYFSGSLEKDSFFCKNFGFGYRPPFFCNGLKLQFNGSVFYKIHDKLKEKLDQIFPKEPLAV